MAEGLSRTILIGNLGADPELRTTQSGQSVLNLRMATTESYFDSSTKERKERTDWHSVVVWGARGKALSNILSKGSRICVEGRNQTRDFDKDGQKHYRTDVVANKVVLLGGGKRSESGSESGGGDDYQSEPDTGFGRYGDDIPFLRNETTQGMRGDWMPREKRII